MMVQHTKKTNSTIKTTSQIRITKARRARVNPPQPMHPSEVSTLLRRLGPQRAYLFVIDGSKALRKAIRDTFGSRVLVQRCQAHKRRNVLAQLPKKLHRSVNKVLHDAYGSASKAIAKRRLTQLIKRLEGDHPGAAASLKEGLGETLSLKDLKLPQALERTLSVLPLQPAA